jgi:hypothetical protein
MGRRRRLLEGCSSFVDMKGLMRIFKLLHNGGLKLSSLVFKQTLRLLSIPNDAL